MAKGVRYEQPSLPEPKKILNFNPLSPLEIEAENRRVMQELGEFRGEAKIVSKPAPVIASAEPLTQTIGDFTARGASKPFKVKAGKKVKTKDISLGSTKAERRAKKFQAYLANRTEEQIALAENLEAGRMADTAANRAGRSTLKAGRKKPYMRTNLDYEKHYPEPAGKVWYPKPDHFNPNTVHRVPVNEVKAAVHVDPISTPVAEEVSKAVTKVSSKASNSTKEMLAKSTLDAIEVVQSRKLGYAAVAAGMGAIYLGSRQRTRKKEV